MSAEPRPSVVRPVVTLAAVAAIGAALASPAAFSQVNDRSAQPTAPTAPTARAVGRPASASSARASVRTSLGSVPTRAIAAGGGSVRSVAYLTKPPARWNPCRPIGYRVNLTGAPKGAGADVDRAILEVAKASGLRFRKVGTTKIVPGSRGRGVNAYPKGTDLVVAYAKPGQSSYLPKHTDVLAMGGVFFDQRVTRAKGRPWHRIVQGYLVVDRTHTLPGGFGRGNTTGYLGTWGQVLMHELGHTVGLAHPKAKDPAQIMYPRTTTKVAKWGLGDRAGLSALGSRSGCL